ncbi:PIG-Y family protein [Sporobolomyces koalae]|uniref:PIG-Y family protein n=1 Tax=Sporobolomyces koalae TaxID=500713 RepID=UPI00317914C9
MIRTRSQAASNAHSATKKKPRTGTLIDTTAIPPTSSATQDLRVPTPSSRSDTTSNRNHDRVETDEAVDQDNDDGREMIRCGYILLIGSCTSLFFGLWSIMIGPSVQTEGFGLLHTMAQDTYYKYLAVLSIPVTTCFVIVNWWGLKIFRHA